MQFNNVYYTNHFHIAIRPQISKNANWHVSWETTGSKGRSYQKIQRLLIDDRVINSLESFPANPPKKISFVVFNDEANETEEVTLMELTREVFERHVLAASKKSLLSNCKDDAAIRRYYLETDFSI